MTFGRRHAGGSPERSGARAARPADPQQEGPSARLVSIVDLRSGIVTERAPNAPTLDVPDWLGSGAREVYLDGIGLMHFRGADGRAAAQRTRPSPLSGRREHEPCFILDPGGRDEHGWQIYRLCVLEPGERVRPPAREPRTAAGDPRSSDGGR